MQQMTILWQLVLLRVLLGGKKMRVLGQCWEQRTGSCRICATRSLRLEVGIAASLPCKHRVHSLQAEEYLLPIHENQAEILLLSIEIQHWRDSSLHDEKA